MTKTKLPENLRKVYDIGNAEVRAELQSQFDCSKPREILESCLQPSQNIFGCGVVFISDSFDTKLSDGQRAGGRAIFVDTKEVDYHVQDEGNRVYIYFTEKTTNDSNG